MLTKYLIIGIIIASLVGGLGFSTKLYMDERVSHAITAQSLETANSTLEAYKRNMAELRSKQVELEETNLSITLENNKTTRDLNDLRNREATVLAKKSLVALRINKAFKKRQEALACLTGDFSLCHESK